MHPKDRSRKKRSKRSHLFGWIVIALALLLSFTSGEEGFTVTFNMVLTWLVAAMILVTLVFEDQLNGYIAGKRMLKGTEKAAATFDTDNPDMYVSETEVGKSEFSYNKLALIAETERYFVFVFSASHAQVYDKYSLSGGTVNEFRAFITKTTGKQLLPVK